MTLERGRGDRERRTARRFFRYVDAALLEAVERALRLLAHELFAALVLDAAQKRDAVGVPGAADAICDRQIRSRSATDDRLEVGGRCRGALPPRLEEALALLQEIFA